MAVNAQAYFSANPDVAASYAENAYGMTPQQFADFHYENYGRNEQRSPTGSVSSQQILDFLTANPNLTDAQIVSAMETYGVSPAQMAQAVGLPEGQVVSRVAAVIPEGNAKLLGDTWVQPVYQVTGSGEDRQVGGIESVSVYKTTGGINDAAAVGTPVQNYTPTGELTGTSQITSSGDTSFFGGLVDALTDPVVLAALGGAAAGGLFGGAGALGGGAAGAAGTGLGTGLTAGAGGLGLSTTGAGLGALGTGAGITAGTGLGTGVLAGSGLGTSLLGAGALTGAGVLGGTTLGTAGLGTAGGTGITAGAGGLGLSTTGAGLGAGTGAGITAGTGLAGTGVLTGSGLGTTLLGTGTGALTGTGVLTGSNLGTTLLGTGAGTGVTGALTTGVGTGTLGTGALTTGVGTGLTQAATTGLTAGQLASLLSTGLTTGAGLLQQQTSKEAAQRAQAMIDTETAAAKQAAQFRPVGMTTRFGTSQFVVDPTTGQLTSAGYTLSPEAKAAQDRFVNLAGQGITQAEQAQAQFAPLQTGAQTLFGLGNQYLAQNPQEVAQNYLNQQMALLQPGRELELANLQNRLQQQGRGGLSVAQGGTLGATTPELQALYNARATQEAQLAAQAQQAGQQQVAFGAGLLGQGAGAMGQYYGGQQAAYQP